MSVSLYRMRSTRQRVIVLALAVFVVVSTFSWLYARSHDDVQRQHQALPSHNVQHVDVPNLSAHKYTPTNCDIDVPRLAELKKRYALEDRFEYYRRHVRFTKSSIPRQSMTQLDQDFVPDQFRTIDLSSSKKYPPETCPPPLDVVVPDSPYPTSANASEFIFGVSTTYKRLVDAKTSPVNEWSYWLTDGRGNSNGGKLVVLLDDASDGQMESVATQLRRIGIDVDVYRARPDPMAARYLALVPALYNHPARQGRKWMVTCDDDTFFPSMHALFDRMAEYDADQMMYVGTLSEDSAAVERHGSQAFGGAGVFLSIPLAAKISRFYDNCRAPKKLAEANSGWGAQGDILLRKCIYEHTPIRLTYLKDLWQMDIMGDPAGFYESGIKPLSVHHYYGGGWHRARPYQTTKIAHVCGEDCPLMRFRTADDFVLSNGYSIAWYPDGADEISWAQVERTFFPPPPGDSGWNYDYKMGPQRQSLHQTGKKMAWELVESSLSKSGSVVQVYIRRRDDWRWTQRGVPMSDVDGVVELVWDEGGHDGAGERVTMRNHRNDAEGEEESDEDVNVDSREPSQA